MPKIILYIISISCLLLTLFGCEKKNAKVDLPIYDFDWQFAEWKKHRQTWNYFIWLRSGLYEKDEKYINDSLVFKHKFGSPDKTKKVALNECLGRQDSFFRFGAMPYTFWVGVRALYSQTTQTPFLWISLDWFEGFYVRHTYTKGDIKNNIPLIDSHLYISQIYRDTHLVKEAWRNKKEDLEYDQHTKRYIEARNGKGHIFDISHYRQFYWLNNLLRNEPLYHSQKKLYQIDSLLRLLHTTYEDHFVLVERYEREGKKLNWFSVCENDSLQGYDFLEYVYPDMEFRPIRYTDGQVDSFPLLKQYMQTEKPTLVYYKRAAVCGSYNWYNYALAFHIRYEGNIPQIQKVQIITPKRVYVYNCPNGLGWISDGEESF